MDEKPGKSAKDTESPEAEPFVYDEEAGERAKVLSYAQASKFAPADRVWYKSVNGSAKEGPYIVVQGSAPRKYRLASLSNISVLVLGGREVDESELEAADQ